MLIGQTKIQGTACTWRDCLCSYIGGRFVKYFFFYNLKHTVYGPRREYYTGFLQYTQLMMACKVETT